MGGDHKDTGEVYIFTWKQYKKLLKKGVFDHDIADKTYWKKIRHYIKHTLKKKPTKISTK